MATCSYTQEQTIPCVEKGDTFGPQEFTLTVNGSAQDLTGATIDLILGGGAGSLSTGSGITITDASNGKFEIDKQIINFSVRNHKYEMRFTFSDGDVKTYMKGTWKVL